MICISKKRWGLERKGLKRKGGNHKGQSHTGRREGRWAQAYNTHLPGRSLHLFPLSLLRQKGEKSSKQHKTNSEVEPCGDGLAGLLGAYPRAEGGVVLGCSLPAMEAMRQESGRCRFSCLPDVSPAAPLELCCAGREELPLPEGLPQRFLSAA